jgi:hypothetical protein
MILCSALVCGLSVGCGSLGGGSVSSQRLRVVTNPTIAEMDRIEMELGIHPSQQPAPPAPRSSGAEMMSPSMPSMPPPAPSPLVGPETEVGSAGAPTSAPLSLPEPLMPDPVEIEPSGGGLGVPEVPGGALGTGATLPGSPLPGADPLEGLTSDGL